VGQPQRRALFVTTSFPRHAGDAAGHFVLAHAMQMRDAGWDVHVIAGGDAPDAAAPQADLRVHWAGGGELFGWPGMAARLEHAPWRALGALPFAARVRSKIETLGPFDRAVAHFILPSAWPLLLDVPCPLHIVAHGGDVRLLLALPSWARTRIVDQLLQRDTTCAFVSTQLRRTLLSRLPGELSRRLEARSCVTPPVVTLPDAHSRQAAAAPWLDSSTRPFAVLAGRMVASKRFDLGLEAAAAARVPTWAIGDGPERARLETLAQRLGSPIRFLGHLPRTTTLGLIERASVLLQPSSLEAAPTVVLEARALGTPVVACAAGDLGHWARRDEGIIIARPEPAAFARRLRDVLATPVPQ
jgi:glycosyltransferase involved in cell wall biosynthesis